VARVNALAEEDVVRRFDRAFPDFAGVTGLIVDLRHAAGGESRYGYGILARLTGTRSPWRAGERRNTAPCSGCCERPTPPSRGTARPRYRFARGRPPRLHGTDRGAGIERDGRGGRGLSGGVPERHARRDHRGAVGRQSGRRAHHHAPQELGDAALGDTPCVPQRGGVRGKGIQPELTVSPTVADVQAGTDPVLERAREYVSGKKR